jgi:hypothetical protein
MHTIDTLATAITHGNKAYIDSVRAIYIANNDYPSYARMFRQAFMRANARTYNFLEITTKVNTDSADK